VLTKLTLLGTLLLSGGLLPSNAQALVVSDATAGISLLCYRLGADDVVSLVFDHSMFGGDVREDYVVSGSGRLRRVSMTTATAAAAEYYAYNQEVAPADGRFLIRLPAQEFETIAIRADRTGRHRLLLGDSVVDLVTLAGDRHRVLIEIHNTGYFPFLGDAPC
jgi:hypothetical protein